MELILPFAKCDLDFKEGRAPVPIPPPLLVCAAVPKYLTRADFDGTPPVFNVGRLDGDETPDVEEALEIFHRSLQKNRK